MAAHETVTGIAKVAHGVYEVTALVKLGAGIDNVADCVFIQKDGGLLRWTTGNNTQYKNCTFVETETAYRLGSSNKNNASTHANAPRFSGNSTCAPVFYGCTFNLYPNVGDPYGVASDFDIGSSDFTNTNAVAPRFLRSSNDAPCLIRSLSQWSAPHIATANIVIDGLVIDSVAQIAGELIHKTTTEVKDLIFVNNHGAATFRHVVFWNPSGWRFSGLSTRSLSVVGDGDLILVDPLGVVAKLDSSWTVGPIQALRTYKTAAIDAVTKATVDSTLVVTDAVNAVKYDTTLVSGLFTGELLHYYQDNGSITINYSNVYRRALVLFGYYPAVTPLTIENRPDGTPVDEGKVLAFPDAGVTAVSQAAVLAFTEITTAEELYDAVHVFQITRTDRHNVGEEIAVSAGTQISFTDQLLVTPSTPSGYPLTVSGGLVTAYTDGSSFLVNGKFNKLIAPTITFDSASVVPSNCTLSADVVFNELGTATGVTFDGNLDFAASGTQTCNGCVIDTLTNSSGSPVTLQVGAGTTIANTPDPSEDITIESTPVSLTINGLIAGGVLSIFDNEDSDFQFLGTKLLEVDPVVGTSVIYVHDGTANDIVIQFLADDYEETYLNVTLTNTSQTFTLQPSVEENL